VESGFDEGQDRDGVTAPIWRQASRSPGDAAIGRKCVRKVFSPPSPRAFRRLVRHKEELKVAWRRQAAMGCDQICGCSDIARYGRDHGCEEDE
jgi:hypothetical protein